ncbi:hypothetical protein AYL99_05852 [Fonsecaea erecta]|uniref:N-acetyltransferase domain-containing protein n=1 Tax=Fonsecaea erecta TaxID=1367422 RepID=A0A178ZM26_9EURO|nr:hypothetical protein AYL99_05852 [Fonsecaea erecta]OAP60850.1 hypothetical protein AYL99_05852 [Fonsecaea erecta]
MPLHVHQLSRANPADELYFPAIARIHLAAWLTVPLMRAIYYGGPEAHPAYLSSMAERHLRAFREEDNCRFAVVVDDTLPADEEVASKQDAGTGAVQGTTTVAAAAPKGKVIAAIKYYFIEPNPPAPSSAASPSPTTTTADSNQSSGGPSSATAIRTWPAYSHVTLASAFWEQLVQARTRLTALLGRHVLVDNLYTDPGHHRRGAGGMLMRHACREADRCGWPSMLEASPKGIGVYESVGFRRFNPGGGNEEQDGSEIWVDLQRWENGGDKGVEFSKQRLKQELQSGGGRGEGWYCQVLMVRPAGSGGSSVGDQKEVVDIGKGEAAVVEP